MSNARPVCTPFGPGVSLYPDPIVDARCERSLMIAVWDRAIKDARWLEAIETRPRSTWLKHDADKYRRLTRGVVDPRVFLAESRVVVAASVPPVAERTCAGP